LETTLRRIGEMLGALADALSEAWAAGAWRPEFWPPAMWLWLGALVVLLALAALRRRQPRPLEVRPPQLLITQGEVVPESTPEPNPRRRRRAGDPGAATSGTLTMTVSNLSRYPVQLLEVALREETRGAPRVAEVEAVVPAMGAVDVAVRVPLALRGDGWIDLYCYAAAPRHKLHRHRAELVWEPWASRFKVAPMDQVAVPVRRLASDERHARFEAEPHDDVVVAEVPKGVAPPPADLQGGASRWAAVAPAPSGAAEAEVAEVRRERAPDAPTPVERAAAPRAPVAEPPEAPRGAAASDGSEPTLGALWDRLPRSVERVASRAPGRDPGSDGGPAGAGAAAPVVDRRPDAEADPSSADASGVRARAAAVAPPQAPAPARRAPAGPRTAVEPAPAGRDPARDPVGQGATPSARGSGPGADDGAERADDPAAGRDPGGHGGRSVGVDGAGATVRQRPRLEFPEEF